MHWGQGVGGSALPPAMQKHLCLLSLCVAACFDGCCACIARNICMMQAHILFARLSISSAAFKILHNS